MGRNINLLLLLLTIISSSLQETSAEDLNTVNTAETAGTGEASQRSVCEVSVPSSVQVGQNIWKKWAFPAEDDLDHYLVNNTGCQYTTRRSYDGGQLFKRVTFEGSLQQHFGIRSRGMARILIKWQDVRYTLDIGYDNNQESYLRFTNKGPLNVTTPDILSTDNYVFFYLKFDGERLWIGKECSPTAMFVTNATVSRGTDVELLFGSLSQYGVKYLYDCPQPTTV